MAWRRLAPGGRRWRRRSSKGREVETIRIREELNVDLAPDGTVYGLELLNANEQLQASDDGALIVVNEAIVAQGDERQHGLENSSADPHCRVAYTVT